MQKKGQGNEFINRKRLRGQKMAAGKIKCKETKQEETCPKGVCNGDAGKVFVPFHEKMSVNLR